MSFGRVTQSMVAGRSLTNMQAALARVSAAQEQLSSGRKITRPSDSPAGTVTAMDTRASMRAQAQMKRNADDGLGWLQAADGAMSSAFTTLSAARSLAVQGANTGASGASSRAALADEVESLRDGLLATANTTYRGRAVFGGTQEGPAYSADGMTYRGDGGTVTRRSEPGSTLAVNTPGDAVFGAGETSVFAELTRVAEHLRSDPAQVSGDLATLDARLGKLTAAASGIGARSGRIERAGQAADNRTLELQSTLADVENVDLPRAIMELQLQQVSYQAALGATAKVIQPTLMDFLR